jgi:hypothetical protein
MITNIIDTRNSSANHEGIDVVIEPSSQHNLSDLMYAHLLNTNIRSAIEWANSFDHDVTLFIYDKLFEFEVNNKEMIIDGKSMIFDE